MGYCNSSDSSEANMEGTNFGLGFSFLVIKLLFFKQVLVEEVEDPTWRLVSMW